MKLKCDGDCINHKGDVKEVEIKAIDGYSWGKFNYCQEAIEEDIRRGFEVIEIDKL